MVTDIAESYIAEGHKVKIAFGREEAPEKYRDLSYKIGTKKKVRVNGLKARIFDNEGFNAKSETKKFIEFANNFNPDILWLHNIHGYYINIEMLFNWIKSRPQMEVKWTLHDCWAFTGHCCHFDFAKCNKWKEGCSNCKEKREYPASIFCDNSKNNYAKKKSLFCGIEKMTIITPSNWLKNQVEQSFLKEYPVLVVNNKIDEDTFKPTKSDFKKKNGMEDKKIILGVASAWGKRKGLDDFIKLSKIIDSRYKIVLVGLTKKQIKKMPKDIFCIERTNSKKELAEIYTASDVFLNLTYEDTYPTVNLESQACGTPCITYDTGGSVESVPKENIVSKGDLLGIVRFIERIVILK